LLLQDITENSLYLSLSLFSLQLETFSLYYVSLARRRKLTISAASGLIFSLSSGKGKKQKNPLNPGNPV